MASRTAQHDDVRVVDHAALRRRTVKVAHGIGQEDLAIETLERGIALKEQHVRVTQHPRCGLRWAFLAGDDDLMRRGVMLEFLA